MHFRAKSFSIHKLVTFSFQHIYLIPYFLLLFLLTLLFLPQYSRPSHFSVFSISYPLSLIASLLLLLLLLLFCSLYRFTKVSRLIGGCGGRWGHDMASVYVGYSNVDLKIQNRVQVLSRMSSRPRSEPLYITLQRIRRRRKKSIFIIIPRSLTFKSLLWFFFLAFFWCRTFFLFVFFLFFFL